MRRWEVRIQWRRWLEDVTLHWELGLGLASFLAPWLYLYVAGISRHTSRAPSDCFASDVRGGSPNTKAETWVRFERHKHGVDRAPVQGKIKIKHEGRMGGRDVLPLPEELTSGRASCFKGQKQELKLQHLHICSKEIWCSQCRVKDVNKTPFLSIISSEDDTPVSYL